AVLAEQLEALQRLSADLDELRHDRSAAASESPAEAAHRRAVLQQVELQRDDFKERLEACREELARRADATEQWAASQAQLSEAQAQIHELRQQLAGAACAAGSVDADVEERIALETELELVRRRAAELAESLAEQKDNATHQQALWLAELKSMRQAIDTQLAGARSAAARPTVEGHAKSDAPPGAAHEQESPVVGSIVEQFAKLQKDVAERRKRKPR
ncbi:MAG: hypothetical protein KDA41_11150, partial [Planctomycetales bacterium]|nr:hypothetical protein [Planctomycetales bacterium]